MPVAVPDPLDDLHRHLSAAMLALADCMGRPSPSAGGDLVAVARLLTMAHQELDRPSPQQRLADHPRATAATAVVVTDGYDESEDERIERQAAEAAVRIDAVLSLLSLSPAERWFARNVGEQLVDVATDAYRTSVRDAKGYCGTCVMAAAAVALAIVREPPPGPPAATSSAGR